MSGRWHHWQRTLGAAGLLIVIDGCSVGPDFTRPAPPTVQRYTPNALAATTVAAPTAHGLPQRFLEGSELEEPWWSRFGCAELDRLVATALAENPSLQAAEAALRVAQENAAAGRGASLPAVAANLDLQRQKTASVLSPTLSSSINPFSLRTAQVLVSYDLDVLGGNRRAYESLVAQADAQRYAWQAARISLAANVVVSAVQAASLHD